MKRIFSWVLALVMIISLLPAVTVLPVKAEATSATITLWNEAVTIDSENPAYYWLNNGSEAPTTEGADANNYNYAFYFAEETGEDEEVQYVPTLVLNGAVFSKTGIWFLKTAATYSGRLDVVYKGVNNFTHSTSTTGGFAYILGEEGTTLNVKGETGAKLTISGCNYNSQYGAFYTKLPNGYLNFIGGEISVSRTSGTNKKYGLINTGAATATRIENCKLTVNFTEADGYSCYPTVCLGSENGLTIHNSEVTITTNGCIGLSVSQAAGNGPQYNGDLTVSGTSKLTVSVATYKSTSYSYGCGVCAETLIVKDAPIIEITETVKNKALANNYYVEKTEGDLVKGKYTEEITLNLDEYNNGSYEMMTAKDTVVDAYTTTGYFKLAPILSADECTHAETTTTSGVPATCATAGTKDKIVCDLCDTVLQDHDAIPQLSVNGEHTPGDEPTCTKGQYCTVCEEQLQNPRYHKFVDHYVRHNLEGYTTYQVSKIPTCTEPGRTSYKTCENCDRYFRWSTNGTTSTATGYATLAEVTSKIDPLGHEYKHGFCIRCNVEDTESTDYVAIDANGKKYRSLAAAVYYADGAEVTLQKDMSYVALVITKDTKINLNGKMLYIKNTEDAAAAITVESGKTLEISNGQLRVIAGNSFTSLIENNGTLVVTDVIIRDTGLGGENPVALLNNGTATIEGVSAVVAATKEDMAIVNNGTCTINLTVTEENNARIQGVIAQEEGELTLTAIRQYGKLTYTAGRVTKGEAVTISAPSGYRWAENVLEVRNPVVEVNGVKYASLQEAIDKANGAEISLLKDITSDALVITKDTKINIGTHTLYIKQTEEKTVAVTIKADATLTLIGGKLRIAGENIYNTFVLVEENGKLVAEDVSIRDTAMGSADAVVLDNRGEAEIKGGTAIVAVTRDGCAIVNTGLCVINIPVDYAATSRIYGAIDNDGDLEEKAEYRHFGNKI